MSRYRRSHTAGACYFFTLALADRNSALLTEHIDRLRKAYRKVQITVPFTTIAICILPDHLHAIWQMPADDADYSTRWSHIKRNFSSGLAASKLRSASKLARREKGIWQRRFWEHEIHDEQDMQRHVDYIHYNPVKHGYAVQVSEWPHSSFHRYVKAGICPRDWAGRADDDAGFGERV